MVYVKKKNAKCESYKMAEKWAFISLWKMSFMYKKKKKKKKGEKKDSFDCWERQLPSDTF